MAPLTTRVINALRGNKVADILISELRKDGIYILMVAAKDRDAVMKALDRLDLSQGPEILVLDDMQVPILEFTKNARKPGIYRLGKQ